jgi:hypothetical protein
MWWQALEPHQEVFYDCFESIIDMVLAGCFEFYDLYNIRLTLSDADRSQVDKYISDEHIRRQVESRAREMRSYLSWSCSLCHQDAHVCICDSD